MENSASICPLSSAEVMWFHSLPSGFTTEALCAGREREYPPCGCRPMGEELNTPPSAEEEWLWAQISVSNDDTQQMLPLVMQEGQIPEYQVGPEVVGDESEGTEDEEQDGDEEQETQLGVVIPS